MLAAGAGLVFWLVAVGNATERPAELDRPAQPSAACNDLYWRVTQAFAKTWPGNGGGPEDMRVYDELYAEYKGSECEAQQEARKAAR